MFLCRLAVFMFTFVRFSCSSNHGISMSCMPENKLEQRLKKLNELKENGLDAYMDEVNIIKSRKSCADVAKEGHTHSGVYKIMIGSELVPLYCELNGSESWIVIQRRDDGFENFYRSWKDYEDGFGDLNKDFWLGLKLIHAITSRNVSYQLRVDLRKYDHHKLYTDKYSLYSNFSVGPSSDNYTLHVGNFSGTAGDSLTYHNNQQFSTKNSDHDNSKGNCAASMHGAWWYRSCHKSNLNGQFIQGIKYSTKGICWHELDGTYLSYTHSVMKIRP